MRHHVTTETVAELGAQAGQQALKMRGSTEGHRRADHSGGSFDPPVSGGPDLAVPSGEEALMRGPSCEHDVPQFVSAFALAADKLQLPEINRVLVISSEVASKGIGPENWETLTLFGDGSGHGS